MTIKFLETITAFDWDLVIPIERIKYISTGYEGGDSRKFFIKIISDKEGSAIECFDDEDKMRIRYEQIKEIIGAK